MDFIEDITQYIQHIWIVILVLAIWAWFYVENKDSQELAAKRRWIEMIPSGISTLGVLGTFFGITIGLYCFDTKNLQESIPHLLEGLKTAFYTSLAGMASSLVLSKKINNLYDDIASEDSYIDKAAGLICQSVANFQKTSNQQAQNQLVFYNLMQTLVQNLDANITSINANINALNVSANKIALDINNLLAVSNTIETNSTKLIGHTVQMENGIESIGTIVNSIVVSVGNIEERLDSHTNTYKEISNNIGELLEHTDAIASTEDEVSDKITILTDKLHGEVVDIEDKMLETNKLLENKFNEFSDLLRKSNTEALVKVMENVTKEFQKQMNALVSRLVKENFEQLNKSVERLNNWQVENKEMITSLTNKYKLMAKNFESTSTSLTKVKENTQSLVSDGGKLDQLVKSLNEVIVKDEKFKEISSNLQKTSDLTRTNMENFDQSTRRLNDWLKQQRNFTDSVAILISKLEEINEIRDYASTFWKETKNGMNDAVGIVKDGSIQLNEQLTKLDEQFYERLKTTLAYLDACIQSLVTNAPSESKK